jgi:DNA-binding transcriptional regulator GbsR (MarR family)
MTEAQTTFIEDMGRLMVGWGLPRTTGRVYGYLLLQRGPATLDDMAATLGIAKSGASVASRQLAQLGLARALGQAGSRRVLYEPLDNLGSIITARSAQMHALAATLRQGARAASGGPGRQRMQSMADWCDESIKQFQALVRRLDKRRSR